MYNPAAAEIYALREGVRDTQSVLWVARDLQLPGVSIPFVVQCDSKQAISFQQDTCVRTRHRGAIDMAETWVQELKDKSKASSVHVRSEMNKADILTKCMDRKTFSDRLGLVSH